ncbi:MAG TPA: hypothetical protein PKH24_16700 [Sedimentisphaerales bacterium]|nr:hypothetical protein [Sedimentisphaerales bacterium]
MRNTSTRVGIRPKSAPGQIPDETTMPVRPSQKDLTGNESSLHKLPFNRGAFFTSAFGEASNRLAEQTRRR